MDAGNQPPEGPEPHAANDEPAVVRLTRRRDNHLVEPEFRERLQGSKPGTRFLRLIRSSEQKLRRTADGDFEATRAVLRPATSLGRLWSSIRRLLVGVPLASEELSHERLSKLKALAVFSSDNLSSSAYATEEILLVLLLASTGALTHAVPISLAIAALAAIVATSYRQLIRAYPGGGGAYVVTRENLGTLASLTTGATLFVDYTLTVAVSTAAGVAAITSAVPELHPLRVEMALVFVMLLMVGNLRGIREAGSLFAIPPYLFILGFGAMILVGLTRLLLGADLRAASAPNPVEAGAEALTAFLVLRAFASGCAALTGIEAIADGVPQFKPPEARNAATTLSWMALILTSFFIGTTVLAREFHITPSESKTVVAQMAVTVFGGPNAFFYYVQVATALILVLAANTAFAGLPTLASVMAKDSVVPKQFAFRGDRLAFSNGILVLGLASSLVLVAFDAETHKIIPLYAFGVFTAFTLSQLGMVVHWRRHKEHGWRRSLLVNATGACVTAVVALIVGATKFVEGAWLSMALMAVVVFASWRIRAHYADVARQLGQGLIGAQRVTDFFFGAASSRPQTVLIPVDQINRAVLRAIAYARRISASAVAIHVATDRERGLELRRQWEDVMPDVPLVIVESPEGSLVEPILAYIEALGRSRPNQMVSVVLTEVITSHFWERPLQNQLTRRLKNSLTDRPNIAVVHVPYHL